MTIPEIQANLDGKLQAYYYLTSQGGKYWEALADPNWNRYYVYITREYTHDEVNEYECEIICSDRQLIERFLSIDCYLSVPDVYIPGTEVVLDVLEPWQATYWKTLPKGYRVRYRARQNKLVENSENSPERQTVVKNAQQWFREIGDWYTDPKFQI